MNLLPSKLVYSLLLLLYKTTAQSTQVHSKLTNKRGEAKIYSEIPRIVKVVAALSDIREILIMKKCSSNSNLDRKTIEKNRRIHMKGLCFKLSSIIPQHHYSSCSKVLNLSLQDMLSQLEQLDHATSYIKKLESRLEELKMRKKQLMAMNNVNCRATASSTTTTSTCTAGDVHANNHHLLSNIMNPSSISSRTMVENGLISSSCSSLLPVLELRDMGSTLEVILISGLNKNFMFYQIITVLEEEGAQVVNASFSTVGDKIFHTIHSQVINSRVGVETSRVCDRLKDLVKPLRS